MRATGKVIIPVEAGREVWTDHAIESLVGQRVPVRAGDTIKFTASNRSANPATITLSRAVVTAAKRNDEGNIECEVEFR